MKVIYREYIKLSRFTVRETINKFHCISYWKPEGTDLLYFRIDAFNIKTIGKDDVIEIIED